MLQSAWNLFSTKLKLLRSITGASQASGSIPVIVPVPAPLHRPLRATPPSILAAVEGHWAGCFLLALLWFAATAWLRPLAIPDEGRYVGVAREMLLRGDWLVPTLNGAPFFHKPPLFYWLTAASMQLLGTDVLAARLASILAAAAVTTGLFVYLRRWADPIRARWAVIVLASTPLFFGGAQYANLDMLVAACIGGAVLCAAHALNSRDAGQRYRVALASAFAVAALGVLAKGLIGAVVPVLVLLSWGLLTGRLMRTLTLLSWAPGVLLFFCLAAPWFIEMQARFPGFDHYFFVVQHFERFASTGFNNSQPIWFYPVVLGALMLPWSPWLLALRRRSYWSQPDPSHTRSLMAAWVVVVVCFFSMPSSKLIGYILPALPPLGFLVADAMRHIALLRQLDERNPRVRSNALRARELSVAVAILVCVGAVIAAHFAQPKSMRVLAQHLEAARHPDEPVIFVDSYYYDVAFYAHLNAPVRVVDLWLPAELAKDSWRRELFDAVAFAPAATRLQLMHPADLPPMLCSVPGAWVVGPIAAASRYAPLGTLTAVYTTDQTALWHVVTRPADALGCARAE